MELISSKSFGFFCDSILITYFKIFYSNMLLFIFLTTEIIIKIRFIQFILCIDF